MENTCIRAGDAQEFLTDFVGGVIGTDVAVGEILRVIPPNYINGPLFPFVYLNRMGISGSRFWVLFKDTCDEEPRKLLALLRAVELGKIDAKVLVKGSMRPVPPKLVNWSKIENVV